MFDTAIKKYLTSHQYKKISIKGVLFDMDGVLYNSMPYHTMAWCNALKKHNLDFQKEEAYMHEGRTGASTINIVYQRQYDRNATPEEIEEIYADKCIEFNKFPEALPFEGGQELVRKIRNSGLFCSIVTGSGQKSLLERIEKSYPGLFEKELMVTAFDVKKGKPNPEPYLMGLEKGNLKPNNAIVIENAPLGIKAATAAGIFTIAINSGPLDNKCLLDAGANILFSSMLDFCNNWDKLLQSFNSVEI